jgi:hypothetical protein
VKSFRPPLSRHRFITRNKAVGPCLINTRHRTPILARKQTARFALRAHSVFLCLSVRAPQTILLSSPGARLLVVRGAQQPRSDSTCVMPNCQARKFELVRTDFGMGSTMRCFRESLTCTTHKPSTWTRHSHLGGVRLELHLEGCFHSLVFHPFLHSKTSRLQAQTVWRSSGCATCGTRQWVA